MVLNIQSFEISNPDSVGLRSFSILLFCIHQKSDFEAMLRSGNHPKPIDSEMHTPKGFRLEYSRKVMAFEISFSSHVLSEMLLIQCAAGYIDQNPGANNNYGGNSGGSSSGSSSGSYGGHSKSCPWEPGMTPGCSNGQCTLRLSNILYLNS